LLNSPVGQLFQVFDLVNEPGAVPTQQLLSADARILGVEGEIKVLPLAGLELGLSVNWLDSTFEDFFVTKQEANGRFDRATRRFDYSGNPTIAAPEWTLSTHAFYDIQVGRWGTLTPRIDYTYQSQSFLDSQGQELISQPEYSTADLRLAYLSHDKRVEFALWVTNFTDEQYLVDVFDLSREFVAVVQVWGEPRTFGATLSVRWP
jgi:iron complex outermembrane receptor protein